MKHSFELLTVFFATLFFLFGSVARAAEIVESGYCGDNVTYELSFDGVLTISGSGEMTSHPWTGSVICVVRIEEGVTSIVDSAFYDCTRLGVIWIPDSVISIGNDAFAFYEITVIGHCTIGSEGAKALSKARFHFVDAKYPQYEFQHTYNDDVITGLSIVSTDVSVTSAIIPDVVTTIGDRAFVNCSSLKSIEIPESVSTIGKAAFSDCTNLNSISIPDSVTSIGDFAFCRCSSLTSISIPDNVAFIGIGAFSECSSLVSFAIPDKVTSISNYVFYDCTSLTSIGIPDDVSFIGEAAFANCTRLTSITIPDGVTFIGEWAFDISAIRYCTIDSDGAKALSKANYSFVDSDYPGIYLCYSFSDVEVYSLYVADADDSIIQASIPENVTSIGDKAFDSCSKMISITLPDGLDSIGSYAFQNCSSITSMNIPDGVTSIGSTAFYRCSAIRYCVIGSNGAKALSKAEYSFVDLNYPELNLRYSYSENEVTGLVLEETNRSVTSIIVPDSVTAIGNSAFFGCSKLVSITIPEGTTSIGDSAFSGCSSLVSITIPEGIISIGNNAFKNCKKLDSISIPASVIYIGNYNGGYAFNGCSAVLYCTIGSDGAKTLSENGFSFIDPRYPGIYLRYIHHSYSHDDILEEIDEFAVVDADKSIIDAIIPDTVTSIGRSFTFNNSGAFSGCASLTSITIPDSVTYIGDGAFSNCISLNSINMSSGLITIGSYSFSGCTSLTSITIPNSATYIGDGAFSNCINLTYINIPESVKSISNSAFAGCSSLDSIRIPDDVEYIGNEAFYYDSTLICTMNSKGAKALSRASFPFVDPAYPEFLLRYIFSDDEITDLAVIYADRTITEAIIPDGVTLINHQTFWNHSNLTSVFIPNSVRSIGNEAFRNCTNLKEIDLPDGLHMLGERVFYNTSLMTLTIPDGVVSLPYSLTRYSYQLTSIIIPRSVIEIEDYAISETITTIYGWRGSYAETWAQKNGRVFVFMDGLDFKDVMRINAKEKVYFDTGDTWNWRYDAVLSPVPQGKVYTMSAASSDESIAVVNGNTVTFLAPGLVKLTIYVNEISWLTHEVDVTVYRPVENFDFPERILMKLGSIERVIVKPENILPEGSYPIFTFTQRGVYTSTYTGESFSIWSDNRPSISTLTAESRSGVSHTAVVVTWESVTGIRMRPYGTPIQVGDSFLPHVIVTLDGSPYVREPALYTLSSDNPEVLRVAKDGRLEALSVGSAWITATAPDGQTASLQMEVVKAFAQRLPEMLKRIKDHAYESTAFEAIVIPDGCTEIGKRAFAACPALSVLRIPASVTIIEDDAFAESENLTIYAPTGSAAIQHAIDYEIPYVEE